MEYIADHRMLVGYIIGVVICFLYDSIYSITKKFKEKREQ